MASRAQLVGCTLVGAAAGCLATAVALERLYRKREKAAALAQERQTLGLCVPEQQLTPVEFDVPNGEDRLLRKAETVLSRRTASVLVVLECLQDGHNYCAVLRTMECLGVQNVWVVSPPPMESKNVAKRQRAEFIVQTATTTRVRKKAQERLDNLWDADIKEDALHVEFAKGAERWLTVRQFESTEECVAALRADNRAVWVTALEQDASVLAPGAPWLQDPDSLPPKVAIVMGAEEAGVSDTFKKLADRLVYLPLCGFAESLNVSVAAALITQLLLQIYTGSRPREKLQLEAAELQSIRADWYAKLARTDADREAFQARLADPPPPLDDPRRPEAHRVVRFHKHNKNNSKAS